MLLARRCAPLQLAKASQVPARALAGPVKVHYCDVDAINGPEKVERTDAKHEMGVLYQPGAKSRLNVLRGATGDLGVLASFAGVPSPMEGTLSIDVIVVDGLVAKTGGDPLGAPMQMIKLSSWCAVLRSHCLCFERPCGMHPKRPCLALTLDTGRPPCPAQGSDAEAVQIQRPALREQAGARIRSP